jgi:hypothetical protein
LDSICFIAIFFSAEESQRTRPPDGSTSPTEHKKTKKGAPDPTASHPNLKFSPENKTGEAIPVEPDKVHKI